MNCDASEERSDDGEQAERFSAGCCNTVGTARHRRSFNDADVWHHAAPGMEFCRHLMPQRGWLSDRSLSCRTCSFIPGRAPGRRQHRRLEDRGARVFTRPPSAGVRRAGRRRRTTLPPCAGHPVTGSRPRLVDAGSCCIDCRDRVFSDLSLRKTAAEMRRLALRKKRS